MTVSSLQPAWVDDSLFPFESRFIDIDGHTVHYVDEGSGPTLLLLHGNPTWSFLWRDVIRALRDDFRCIALDYPGFGLSTPKPGYRYLPEEHADVVTAFIERLGVQGATLVGQDWGGPIGLATEVRRPGTFDRLVLANAWAWPVNGDLYFEAFACIGGGPPIRFLARRLDLFVNAFLPGQIIGSRSFFAGVEAGLADLARLPTLIVWSSAQIGFRPQERERLEAAFPEHETVIVDGAGIYVESDAPEEFVAAIRDWTASR